MFPVQPGAVVNVHKQPANHPAQKSLANSPDDSLRPGNTDKKTRVTAVLSVKNEQLHVTQQVSAKSAHNSPIRNVTPITDCISHLKQSASPVGDAFHFFESIDAKDELIRFYRQKTDAGFLFMIRHPNDLDHHPLRRLHYYPTPGQKNECPGLIYQSVPITLIFDCDNLRPRQLASLNELLENPPRLDGIPISTTVSRVVLAKNDLIYQPDAPGPDFWRRIFARDKYSSATFNVTPTAVPSWSVSQRTEPPEPGSLLIHCAGQDVFASLFGNLAINSHGEQYFRNGVISSQPDPVTICLVDPPDAKSPFWQHLSDILEQGYFIANGERVELPASLVLQQYHTPTENITAFKQAVNNTPVLPGKTCGVINTHNFSAVFSDLSAQENTLQKTDTFHKMASEFDQLLISGELTNEQWLILKHRTESLPVAPGLVTGTLPEPFGDSVVRLYTGRVANNVAAHCYQLATGQQWEELWFTSKLKLSGKLNFQLRETPLLTQLLKGKPVVLSGLEHTPTLAGHLESLLSPEPYLWIYGQKKALPHCQLHIVWPTDRLPDQGPWFQRWQQQQDARSDRSAGSVEADSFDPEIAELGKAESILAESIMAAPKSLSSRHPDAIGPLCSLWSRIQTLPQSPDESYPVIPVQAPAEFLKLLEAQLPIEQRLDRAEILEPFHWRKALNKLLAHPVRGNTTIYSYVKAQISGIFPDSMAEVDRDGIAAILNTLPALKHPKDLADDFQSVFV